MSTKNNRESAGPPAAPEAERYIVGSILRDNSILVELDALQAVHFFDPALGKLYGLAKSLEASGRPVDLVSLAEALGADGVEDIGGTATITSLFEAVEAPVNVQYYAGLVRNKSVLREMIRLCRTAIDGSYGPEPDAGSLSADLENGLYQLVSKGRTDSLRIVGSLLGSIVEEVGERFQKKVSITGISTGYAELDKKINGLKPSDLIVVAGRPGMGKTSLVLNMAESIVLADNPLPVLVFSLEMSAEQLLYRMIASRAHIDAGSLQRGLFDQDGWETFLRTVGDVEHAPLYIDDDPTVSVEQILSKTRHLQSRLQRQKEKEAAEKNLPTPKGPFLGAVIVDYLQLMVGKSSERREREISEISRGLKILAKELKVPVLALSQLNRSLESRPDKRPVMSDLRESGAIEQDADLILFIYREAMYRKKDGEDDIKDNTAEIIIGKNRHGPIGTIELEFEGRFTRFMNKDGFAEEGDEPY